MSDNIGNKVVGSSGRYVLGKGSVSARARARRAAVGIAIAAIAVVLQNSAATVGNAEPGSGGRAVPVPAGYEYNPNDSRPEIHDYCSYTGNGFSGTHPVDWPSITDADFRGACAKHDMCYERDSDLPDCDDQLSWDLAAECLEGFPGKGAKYAACLTHRDNMMAVVRLADWRPWN